jgi:hypothetical protein
MTALLVLPALALGGGPEAAAVTSTAPRALTAHQLRARPHAVRPGTRIAASRLFGNRVFPTARRGIALANAGQAQYPALTVDGGRTWRIDGPQLHVDAADAPEAVGSVGAHGSHTFFAFGSSAIDVTTDSGRTWWETLVGGLVVAVVPGTGNHLVAYVQSGGGRTAQYVSRDGGRHWRYSTALGGG